MKIAVASSGPTIDDYASSEFDHCNYLLIVDVDTMAYEAMVSPMRMAEGTLAARLFAQQLLAVAVTKVLANHVDFSVLKPLFESSQGMGIQIIEGANGSVRDVVRQFREMCMADTVVIPCKSITD